MTSPRRADINSIVITLGLILAMACGIHLVLRGKVHNVNMTESPLLLADLQSSVNKLQLSPQDKGKICFTVETEVLLQHNIILDVAGVCYNMLIDNQVIAQNKQCSEAKFISSYNFFFIPHEYSNSEKLTHVSIDYTPRYYNFSPSIYVVTNSSLKKIRFYLLIIHSVQILIYILLTLFCLCAVFLAKNKTSVGIAVLQIIICFKVFLTGGISDVSPVDLTFFFETKHIMDICIFSIINYYVCSYNKKTVKLIFHLLLSCFIAITTFSIFVYHPICSYIQGALIVIYCMYLLTRASTDKVNRNTHYYYLFYGSIALYLFLAAYKAISGNLLLSLINVSNVGFILLSFVITLKYVRHLLEQVAEYKRKEASLKRVGLLKNIGHDLKTPLTIIKTNNQILNIHSVLEKKDVEMLVSGTLTSITDLDRMINNINALLSEGGLDLDEDISLKGLFKSLYHKYNAFSLSKNIVLEIDMPQRDIMIKSNEALLRRVINNLIENAIKYNKNDGKIKLIFMPSGDNVVKIIIADKGIGMTKEQLDNIFTPFYRVAQSRSIAGLGLGLAVVKHLLEYLNGEILVESKIDYGSQFEINLKIK